METMRLRKDYLVLGRNQIIHMETMYVSNTRSKSVGIFFMIPCISFYNLIQCSRRIVHIRHHATDIDEVSVRCAIAGGVCLYLTPKLCNIFVLYGPMDMTVEHECSWGKTCTEEWDRIMAHHNMLAAVLDFLLVRNFLKHALCGGAELLGIVIAPYQHLIASK